MHHIRAHVPDEVEQVQVDERTDPVYSGRVAGMRIGRAGVLVAIFALLLDLFVGAGRRRILRPCSRVSEGAVGAERMSSWAPSGQYQKSSCKM